MSSNKRKTTTNTSTNYNFRPQTESQKWETKGTKPLPKPVSVQMALLTMIIHVCRKLLFANTMYRVAIYAGGLFLSFAFDVYPFPKTYFARSDNFLNQYFVKLGWAWTLFVTLPFVSLTSFTICCGKRNIMLKQHFSRLLIATMMWFVFTKSFAFIEANFGKCSMKSSKFTSKQMCLSGGYYWHSLDISGHSFILIYSVLVIIEEARAIIGWETIQDLIRNEEHTRASGIEDAPSPIKSLSDDEFFVMKSSYTKFVPFIRALFIVMTLLTGIWDIMIFSTILYFHIMIEKLIGGLLAIVVWFVTYRVWFPVLNVPPSMPGDGLFKYNKPSKKTTSVPLRRTGSMTNNSSSRGDLPKFMGMPLYGLRTQPDQKEETKEEVKLNASDVDIPTKVNQSVKFQRNQPVSGQFISRPGMTTRSQLRNNGNVTI